MLRFLAFAYFGFCSAYWRRLTRCLQDAVTVLHFHLCIQCTCPRPPATSVRPARSLICFSASSCANTRGKVVVHNVHDHKGAMWQMCHWFCARMSRAYEHMFHNSLSLSLMVSVDTQPPALLHSLCANSLCLISHAQCAKRCNGFTSGGEGLRH